MLRLPVSSFASLIVLALCLPARAQTPPPPTQPQPTILKVDPPNWYPGLPNPMLLIQGTGLNAATFTSPAGATILHSRTSPNGHWAMLWLNTHSARPGTLHITAKAAGGSTTFNFPLTPRRTQQPLGFSSRDVLYCIMPDRFADGDLTNDPPSQSPGSYDRSQPRSYHGGDLRGVTAHLDYLQALGVTTVWLTPVVANDPHSTDYHGYGATDMYAVDPHLGSLANYRELGQALHLRHMKLVFDDVPNHVGPHHPWVGDSPLPDWFHGTLADHSESNGNFDSITDPHATSRASHDALDGWFVNRLPDMNQQNPVVAQYLAQNMIWWIEQGGIDGLRIDTFPYVQRKFWQNYLQTLKTIYPRLTTIGEVSGGDPTINAFFTGGRSVGGVDTHLDTPFDYPLYYALRDVLLHGKPMAGLEATLRQDWLYPHPENLATFLGNHDVPRFLSEPNASPALLRIAIGMLMTLRGMPQLYAGDEIDMLGGEDPDNRRDFPGGFPGDPQNAFTSRTPEQAAMHDWVAGLGHLRAHSPTLQSGRHQTVFADDTSFVFLRLAGSSESACVAPHNNPPSALILVNRSSHPSMLQLSTEGTALQGCASATPALGDAASTTLITQGNLNISLPPFGFAIYDLR